MDVTKILHNLNSQQEIAVTSDHPHLLVLAGAGSGKTRILVHRIAWKIQVLSIPSHAVLAVTFTNKAARDVGLPSAPEAAQARVAPHAAKDVDHLGCLRALVRLHLRL